jgi:hypothetical protein
MGHPIRISLTGGWPMQFKVQPLLCANEGHEETTHEIAILEKDCQRIEYRGLTLAEAKQILSLPKIRKRRSC